MKKKKVNYIVNVKSGKIELKQLIKLLMQKELRYGKKEI